MSFLIRNEVAPVGQEVLKTFSHWRLVCEEFLDHSFEPAYYDACWSELETRGFSRQQITDMRELAGETVGWMHFEKQVWDWKVLDEKDIRFALEWKKQEGEITLQQYEQMKRLVDRYEAGAA